MRTEVERRPEVAVAPLMPIALALAAGIALDRYGDPWSPFVWGTIALGAVSLGAVRRGGVRDLALLVAFAAIGGGWHHYRWSDLEVDDLSQRVSETPRPAWVRGVLREVLGKASRNRPLRSVPPVDHGTRLRLTLAQ
jgi:hypothetical protein